MSEFSQQVAIVTGGGSGIGLAFTTLLHSKDCSVVIGDLNLTDEAKGLVESAAGKVIFKQTDVTNWKQLGDLFAFTEEKLGAPDIVCPGAGIFEPKWSSFWNDTEDDGYKTIDINITHPTKATRFAIRSMINAKKGGTIVHISSIGGQITRLAVPIYCATKAYVNHFVRAFAGLEAEQGIRVLGVAPGLVRSPLWFKENTERLKAVGESDLWIEPSEIAEILLECCGNKSRWPSGTIIEASGQGRKREVKVFNDEGPPGIGHSKGANTSLEDDVFAMLREERARAKEARV